VTAALIQESEILRLTCELILASVGVFPKTCKHGMRRLECANCLQVGDKSRQAQSLQRMNPESRPNARRHNLHSKWPLPSYLRYLVRKKGYNPDAAAAASPLRAAPPRRTKTGAGFSQEEVLSGLSKMWTNNLMKAALFDIVHHRASTLGVSNVTGIPVEKLYVYASRLRGHIRKVVGKEC